MKAKKILFTSSGIIKCVVGGGVFVIFGLLLLLSGLLQDALATSGEMLQDMVKDLTTGSDKYAFLNDYNPEQVAEYLMGIINGFAVIVLIFAGCTIVSGVFSLIFARRYDDFLSCRLGRKILYCVLDVIFSLGLIAKALSTIALFIKDKPIVEIIKG